MEIKNFLDVEEFLRHKYFLPEPLPTLPLNDETFFEQWSDSEPVRNLKELLGEGIKFSSTATLGGRLPIVETYKHEDFLTVEAVLNGRQETRKLPPTINAFTIAKNSYRVILLNRAPYSNVAASRMGLTESDWLEKSHVLRLHHECAHYETLRIFGGMRNHPLDEILADAVGQIAAFGDFRADRQRIFFGLKGDQCDGRLSFYCRKLKAEDRRKVYRAVDESLDILTDEINGAQTHFERLKLMACRSIEEVLKGRRRNAD